MPDRMQKAAEKEKDKAKEKELERRKYEKDCTFEPRINKPKDREFFQKAQQKFLDKLNQTKQDMRLTRPISPKVGKHRPPKPLKRDYVNESTHQTATNAVSQAAGGDKLRQTLGARASSAKPATSKGPVKQPASTRSQLLRQQKNRENIEKANAERERKAKEDADRVERQNRVSRRLWAMLGPPATRGCPQTQLLLANARVFVFSGAA